MFWSWIMDAINSFIGWLFGDKTGVLFLVLGGILLFLVISFVLERKTKKMYFNHKKTEDDWDLFGEDEEGWSDFDADNK
jgi:hypothetical protein